MTTYPKIGQKSMRHGSIGVGNTNAGASATQNMFLPSQDFQTTARRTSVPPQPRAGSGVKNNPMADFNNSIS